MEVPGPPPGFRGKVPLKVCMGQFPTSWSIIWNLCRWKFAQWHVSPFLEVGRITITQKQKLLGLGLTVIYTIMMSVVAKIHAVCYRLISVGKFWTHDVKWNFKLFEKICHKTICKGFINYTFLPHLWLFLVSSCYSCNFISIHYFLMHAICIIKFFDFLLWNSRQTFQLFLFYARLRQLRLLVCI